MTSPFVWGRTSLVPNPEFQPIISLLGNYFKFQELMIQSAHSLRYLVGRAGILKCFDSRVEQQRELGGVYKTSYP
jgi:hypothetical protein